MILISGDTQIEYGMTPAGQYFEKHSVGSGYGIIRITQDAERFLRWIIVSEVNREIEDTQRKKLVSIVKGWWDKPDPVCKRGHFNSELYYKIIEAKRDNGTLYR